MTKQWKSILTVAILIIVALIIRFGIQHGGKPLRDVHPWDYILMVVTVIIALGYLYFSHRRKLS